MLPFIRNGDVVELAPLEGMPARGEIVVGETAPGRYVIHRVVRVVGDDVWLRGDSQRRAEGPVAREMVFGAAAVAERGERRRVLDRGVWRWLGRVWIATHPLGLVALWVLLRVWRVVGGGGRSDRDRE